MSDVQASTPTASLARSYASAGAILVATIVWLCIAVAGVSEPIAPGALIPPMLALFCLTVVVWFLMLVVRNIAFVRGRASTRYFMAYQTDLPSEQIERPARTFNNLMQVPSLFYVICLLMLVTQQADQAQLMLAWTFVALRLIHAAVYIGINLIPYRFATWVAGFITLCVIWFRFASHASWG